MFKKDHNLFKRGYPLAELTMFIHEHADNNWDSKDLKVYREEEANYFSERTELFATMFSQLEGGAFIPFTEAVIKSGFDFSKHKDVFIEFMSECLIKDLVSFKEVISKGDWEDEFLNFSNEKLDVLISESKKTIAFQSSSSGDGHPAP